MNADDLPAGMMIMQAARRVLVALALVPSAASLAAAQSSFAAGATEPLRLLGLSVAASGGPRDTLGLLIATVVRDGPADQAGITTGSRVLAVNGQAVRLSPNDIGRPRAADSVLHRFDEVIRSTASSADVTLRVVGGGRTRNVSLATADRRGARSESSAAQTAEAPTSGLPTGSAPQTAATVTSAPAGAVSPDSGRPKDQAPTATIVTAPSGTAGTTIVPVATAAAASAPPSVAAAAVEAASAVPAVLPAETAPLAPATLSVLIDALLSVQLDLRRMARDAQPRALTDSLTDLEHDVALLRARLRKVQGARSAAGITEGGASAAMTPPTAFATPTAPAAHTAANAAPTPSAQQQSPASASTSTSAPAPVSVSVSVPSAAPAAVTAPVSTPSVAPAVPSAPKATIAGLELARVSGDLAVFLGPQAEAALLVQSASETWEPLRAGDVVLKVDGSAPDLTRLREALAAQQAVTLVVLRRGRTFTVAVGGTRQP